MMAYINEFLGTMIMIILCNGAVASASLKKSAMKGAGSLQLVLAGGLSLLVPCCIFGTGSGTYYNSALTLALAIEGTLEWLQAAGYIAAQFAGAIVGAIAVYVYFKDQFNATEDPSVKLNVFVTSPAIPDIPVNMFSEVLSTFVLVLAIKGIGVNAAPEAGKYLVPIVMAAVSMSLGGTTGSYYSVMDKAESSTGCAMNPVRDLAPRLAHAFLPIKCKGSSCWGYAIVPALGPVIGAIAAVMLFGMIGG